MSLDAARGLLACPHCRSALEPEPGRWACPAGHSFDVARQGYLNLSGAPASANADTAAMVDARARVLGAGVFEVLTRGLGELVPTDAATLLEAGAGTAHYLAGLVEQRSGARGVALDVSRPAARRAARAHPRVAAVVADVWRPLPLLDDCVDVVLCVFAPRNLAEFARVLRPSGLLAVVTPAKEHLAGLRSRYGLLGLAEDKGDMLVAAAGEHFDLIRTVRLRHAGHLSASLVNDLINMGPNAHHHPPRVEAEGWVEVAVEVSAFRPR